MADEELNEYVQKMGTELGNLCHELWEEYFWLKHKWREFQELYQKGDERLNMLNTVASNFFYIVQKLLYEDGMLTLCRLTDPPKNGRFQNLTVMRLSDSISDPTLKATVQAQAEQLRSTCQFARDVRNRRLAHRELPAHLGGLARSLPNATSAQIEDALKRLRDLLWSIDQHYGLTPSLSMADPFGAQSLMGYLELAVRADEAEKQHWLDMAKEMDARRRNQ